MSEKFDLRLAEWKEQIDDCLNKCVDDTSYPDEFKEILKYALFPGGKRLRPVLFLEWHSMYTQPDKNALWYACGIEMMHSYSLIHDDMPCMDNDDFRRGKPSVHKKYGEAKALLAGDALLDMAYNAMIDSSLAVGDVKSMKHFSLSGDRGIIHGQYLDLYRKNKSIDDLIDIYEKKTASLIKGSCLSGYAFSQKQGNGLLSMLFDDEMNVVDLSGVSPEEIELFYAVERFGKNFGIAFQLYDDISEYIAGEKTDGTSVLDFLDLAAAKELLNNYLNTATTALSADFGGDTSFLKELVEKFIIV